MLMDVSSLIVDITIDKKTCSVINVHSPVFNARARNKICERFRNWLLVNQLYYRDDARLFIHTFSALVLITGIGLIPVITNALSIVTFMMLGTAETWIHDHMIPAFVRTEYSWFTCILNRAIMIQPGGVHLKNEMTMFRPHRAITLQLISYQLDDMLLVWYDNCLIDL